MTIHALALTLGLLGLGSAIYVAWLYLRSEVSGKALWALLALVGVVRWDVIWDTGETVVRPLSIVILTVAVGREPSLDSWIVSFSVPLGAMVGYGRWRFLQDQDSASS